MPIMRSHNPTITRAFDKAGPAVGAERMTIAGTANKTLFLVLLLMLTASWSWNQSISSVSDWGGGASFAPTPLLFPSMILALVIGLVTSFKMTWAPFLAPAYALTKGVVLGAVSVGFEASFPGIVFQAILGTFGTLAAMLLLYRSGVIKVTDKFRMVVGASMGGIFLIYLISFVLSFFGIRIPMIHDGGPVGIAFSLFVIVIAALMLAIDFDRIEEGERAGAPKYMEWYSGFALLVTLIWLYLEILRLLSKLRGRN